MPTVFWRYQDCWLDGRTPLRIQGHKGTIRHLLTAYLPLSSYSRLLWLADSSEQNGKLHTQVRFRGSLHPPKVRLKIKREEDFAAGQLAYVTSLGTKDGTAKAVEFIEKQMGKKEPMPQVRWAMLFLGAEKAKDRIPVLLRHLEYRYSPWGVLGEAHPAVKRLRRSATPPAMPACNNSALRREPHGSACSLRFCSTPGGWPRPARRSRPRGPRPKTTPNRSAWLI